MTNAINFAADGTVVTTAWFKDVNNFVFNNNMVNVVTSGADNTGAADSAAALTTAITALPAAGGVLYFPAGTYLLNSSVTIPSNVRLVGYGVTINIAHTTAFTGGAFYTQGSNVVIEGFKFDMGFTRCATYAGYPNIQNCAIFGDSGAINLKVFNCQFSNLFTVAIQYYTADTLEIRGCQFTSPAQTQQQHLEFIWLLTVSGRVTIENCSFTNAGTNPATGVCAVFASGTTGPVLINRCWTNNCSRDNTGSHRLETFAFYGNSVDVRVENTFCFNQLSAWVRLSDTARVRIVNNYATMIASGAATDTAFINAYGTILFVGTGGQVGIQDIEIVGNTLINNASYTGRSAIAVGSQDFSIPVTDVHIRENRIEDFHVSVDVYGPVKDVRVEKNQITSVNGGQIIVEYGAPTALNGVTEAASSYDGIYINDNYVENSDGINISGIAVTIDTGGAEYTGTLGQIEINKNRVVSDSGSASQGIVVRGVNPANSSTRSIVDGNDVNGYSIGIYSRFSQEAIVKENRVSGNTTPITQSNNTVYSASGNRYASGGVSSGRAVLVAGTKTVSTTEVQTGDNIILTNVVTGGTAGFLNVGTIVAGTSFVIHSSNASDTSTIYWEIRH